MTTRLVTCHLCEAVCGLAIDVEDNRITAVRGDRDDPFSRGHVCPKAAAIGDVLDDPDRVREPLRRVGDRWEPVGWREAIDDIATRLHAIQTAHGRDAVAWYYGNPVAHNYGALLYGVWLKGVLGSRNVYSANSLDALPRLLVSYWMYGSQAVLPIADLDRTMFLLVVGANPVVSNGSIMTAPGVAKRLEALRARGGRLVVVDPRRTETAAVADEHLAVRPGADAALLASLLQVIFAEKLAAPGPLADRLAPGALAALEARTKSFAPERVSAATGVAPERIRDLARAFARSPSAVCYGRMGACTQPFGALTSWLVDVLNVVTGNLDRPGGAMFPQPAFDLAPVASALGESGSFGRWRSRVRGLPEFNGELPAATLADEIEAPGDGRIRALLTNAANPVLSVPGGRRLEKALAGLDLVVAIDLYRNETTRHAHYILPPSFGPEHDHYPMIQTAVAVRNFARYAPAAIEPPPGVRHDWEILLDLTTTLLARRGRLAALGARAVAALLGGGPARTLDLALRVGPHRLSLRALRAAPHGLDLGALTPRLGAVLRTPDRRIALAPAALVADLARLEDALPGLAPRDGALVLIGRRDLRSNNSWMHNAPRLAKGRDRCTLKLHPADAAARGIRAGDAVRVETDDGAIEVAAEPTDEMAPGVVSLPHGWGHHREGAALSVAAARPGASANDVVPGAVDPVSGVSVLNGVPVRVAPAAGAGAPAAE